jgi:hypothetical protein
VSTFESWHVVQYKNLKKKGWLRPKREKAKKRKRKKEKKKKKRVCEGFILWGWPNHPPGFGHSQGPKPPLSLSLYIYIYIYIHFFFLVFLAIRSGRTTAMVQNPHIYIYFLGYWKWSKHSHRLQRWFGHPQGPKPSQFFFFVLAIGGWFGQPRGWLSLLLAKTGVASHSHFAQRGGSLLFLKIKK